MATWEIEYYSGGSWLALPSAVIDRLSLELNGHEEAMVSLTNNSTNRSIIANDTSIRIKYNSAALFNGVLYGSKYERPMLTPIIYNEAFEKLKKGKITADYSTGTSSQTIAQAICTAAGVTYGGCPNVTVAVKFISASTWDAWVFLSKTCVVSGVPSDYWYDPSDGKVYIGNRGVNRTGTYPISSVSNRAVDRSKMRNHTIARSKSTTGVVIEGHAYIDTGTGDIIEGEPPGGYTSTYYTFSANMAYDVATLQHLAAAKLAEIRKDTAGSVITIPISTAYQFSPGDKFTNLNYPEYALSNSYSYRISKMVFRLEEVDITLERTALTVSSALADTKSYEDQGIYISGGAAEANLSMEGVQLQYNFDEASGTTVYDLSENNLDGSISGAVWATGRYYYALQFRDSQTDWVDTTAKRGDLNITDEYTVCAWVQFTTLGSVYRAFVGDWGSAGAGRTINIGLNSSNQIYAAVHLNSSEYDAISTLVPTVGNWYFIAVTMKIGGDLKLYINSYLLKTTSLSGTTAFTDTTPTQNVVLGRRGDATNYFFGLLDIFRIFNRVLTSDEVYTLQMFGSLVQPVVPPGPSSGWEDIGDVPDINVSAPSFSLAAEKIDTATEFRTWIKVTITRVTDAGGYDIAWKKTSDTLYFITHVAQPSSGNVEWSTPDLLENTNYTFLVRSVSMKGQASAWSASQNQTTGTNSVAPSTPTGLTLTAVLNGILIEWSNIAATTDFYKYRVYADGSNPPTTLIGETTFPFFFYKMEGTSYSLTYVAISSVDLKGNESAKTTASSTTPLQIKPLDLQIETRPWTSNVTFGYSDGNYDYVAWTAGNIKFADTSDNAINSGNADTLATGLHYFYWNNTSTLQHSQTYSDAVGQGKALMAMVLIESGKNPTILPFNSYTPTIGAGAIAAKAIRSEHLITDTAVITNSLQLQDGIITNAKVDGTIGIYASKIFLSGTVFLNGWQKTGDLTKIDGGQISANTVTATQINVVGIDSNGKLVLGQVGSGNLDDIPETGSDKTVTANEKTGAGRAYSDIDANGNFIGAVFGGHVPPTTYGAGLYISSTHLGYYTGSAWQVYIGSDGKFYFTGDANNFISWNGTSLSIKGSIVITGGSGIANLTDAGDLATQDNLDGVPDGATYKRTNANEKSGAGYAYTGLDSSGRVKTAVWGNVAPPTGYGAGLYLGSTHLGYYGGTDWKTYMDNSGNFYLKGTSGTFLEWSGGALTIASGIGDVAKIVISTTYGLQCYGLVSEYYLVGGLTTKGIIGVSESTSSFVFFSDGAYHIRLDSSTGNIVCVGSLIPSGTRTLGTIDYKWNEGYITNAYATKFQGNQFIVIDWIKSFSGYYIDIGDNTTGRFGSAYVINANISGECKLPYLSSDPTSPNDGAIWVNSSV